MSINLASRLSAITTDFAGVNHIVWVEDNAIWHAQFDANAGTWVNAQRVVEAVPGNVTDLNLVANEKLIGNSSPGLAVIWQQGDATQNNSNFYYSAAQYSDLGQLQWDATPTTLTVNESSNGSPFTNLAPQAIADNNGQILVVGQQVNLLNAVNQAIREDVDLYTASLTIDAVTPATSTALTAPYNPPTIVDGVNQGPGIPINQNVDTPQAAVQTSAFSSISETSTENIAPAAALTASASSSSSGGGFQGLGFKFGPSLSFSTGLLEALGLDEYLFGIPLRTLESTLKEYELAGTLGGTTNFDNKIQLTSKGKAVKASTELTYDPWQIRPSGVKKTGSAISFAYDSKGAYQNQSPYDLVSITDVLSLTATETIPIFNKPAGLIAGKITFTGSVGLSASLSLKPINPADSDNLVQILLDDVEGDAATVLLTAFATQLFGGGTNEVAAVLIGDAVFAPIENLLLGNLTDASNLMVADYLVGPTLGAALNGQTYTDLFPLLKLNASGGVTLFFGFGQGGFETTVLSIPLSLGASLGPLEVNASISPTWSWPSNPPLPNATSAIAASSFSRSSFAASAATANPTGTVAGTLLTLNFDAPLDPNAIPTASDFSVQVATGNASAVPITVGGVLVNNDPTTGNGVVVLQLSQAIAYSPQFTGTNPQPNGQAAVTVGYSGTTLEYSDNTPVSDFSNLSVTNNSPQNLAVTFNPVSGNSNDYTTQNQTTLLNNLEADYAQDSPPALTLVSSSTNTEGQVLAVWSREVQPLTPIAGFVNGNEVYLNFVQGLNTSSLPSKSQFTVLVNGVASNLTVTNVAIAAGGYIQLNLSGSVTSTDVVTITYQPSATDQSNNLFLTDAVEAQLWIPAFSETLTNATGQSTSTAPTLLGGAVIIDNGANTPNNLVTLIFDGLLNTEFIPDGSAFTVVNNSQTYNESISNVTVSGNVVTFNLPAPAQTPLISQGDITVVTYTPGSVSDQNLTGANGVAIATVSTTLTTLPETPTTTLMAGFYTPGSTGGLTHFQNIPGADNFNLDPAVASDTNGNALAVWVYTDTSDIANLTTPGEFYTDNQAQVILDNLNQSDIYFSYWNGSQWTIATPLATNQPGTDSNVTVAYDPTSQTYIAAWLNTQTTSDSTDNQTTIYWASYNPTQKTWSSVNQVLSEATPDPLADLVISSVNGEPALFWTQTQPVSYSQLTEEENPDLYLRLGELSGTTAKNSGAWGYAADGVYNGSVTLRETGALYDSATQSGDPNSAALFESGGSVTLNSALNTSGSAFSVEFWFKIPNPVSATTNLIDLDGIFSVVLNSNGTLTFGLDNSSSITTSASATPIKNNTWYYVVGTYTNQTQELSLYLNGQPVQTVNGVDFTLPTSAALTVAGGTDAVYLDEIALYGSALSYSTPPTSGEDITGLTLLDSVFGADQIGTKYGAQYVDPLPPGPQTQYSLLNTNIASPGNFSVGAESNLGSALIENDGTLYLAYADPENGQIYLATSTDLGKTWSTMALPSTITTTQAPGLAFFDGALYLAYVQNTSFENNEILMTYSANNGQTWSESYSPVFESTSSAGLSLVVYQDQLMLFYNNYVELDVSNPREDSWNFNYAYSDTPQDPFTWYSPTSIDHNDTVPDSYVFGSINATVLNNTLYLAYQRGSLNYQVSPPEVTPVDVYIVAWTTASPDNFSSDSWFASGPAVNVNNINIFPGITNDGNQLYFVYADEEGELYYLTSSDGNSWSSSVATGYIATTTPSPTFVEDLSQGLYVGYLNANASSADNVYVAVTGAGTPWSDQTSILPIPFIQPTQLSDANIPVLDVVSNTTPNSTGNIYPNGQQDTVFSTTISGQQGKTIESITLTLSNGKTYSVGGGSTNNQLGVIVGDTLINSPAPSATLAYPIMGASLTLNLLVDTGANPSASITANGFTINFTDGPSYTAPSSSLPQFVPPNSVPVTPGNVPVMGTATVTETEDSSLTLIDSGFVIDTTNPGMGYSVVSADFNNDGKSDVAVGNRGYANTSGAVLNNGTVQILLGGQPILLDDFASPLSPPTSSDSSAGTSGNTGGISIVGIPDGGQTNGQFPLSMATGDVNNDGYIDLVIGSPNNSKVYVIYGSYLASTSAETVIDVTTLTSAQGYAITSPNGTASGDRFGFAVTVGNFNGSGGADIAIGAPNASNGQGEVYVAYNGSTSVAKIYTGSSYTSSGTPIGEQAGYALATSAYVSGGASTFSDSTSTDNLIIGAPNHTIAVNNSWTGLEGLPTNTPNPYPTSSPVNVGAVYVFTSSGSGLESSPSYTYLGTDANTPSANGAAQSLFAGAAIASDDWNGDGYMDLAIAAPGGDENDGTVYVLSGKTATTNNGNTQYLNLVSNLTIEGGLPLGQAGAVVTSAGDVNDDNYTDLLITAPQGANGTGQGYVLFGQSEFLGTAGTTILDLNVTASDNKATFLLNGNFPYQLTGQATSAIGDVNNDGVDDLMITAPNATQLYSVYGHPWLADEGSIKLADISGDNGFVIDGNLYTVVNNSFPTVFANIDAKTYASTPPSLTTNQGTVYLGYLDFGSITLLTSNDNGQTWSGAITAVSGSPNSSPALAFFNGILYLAYQQEETGGGLYITSSTDNGSTWTTPYQIGNFGIEYAPSLAVYQDQLMAFFINSTNSDIQYVFASSNGLSPVTSQDWSQVYTVANPDSTSYPSQTASGPVTATAFNDALYVAYVGGTSSNVDESTYITSTTGTQLTNLTWEVTNLGDLNVNYNLSLSTDNTTLYLGYANTSEEIQYLTSSNGASWSDPTTVPNQSTDSGTALTTLNGGVLLIGYTLNTVESFPLAQVYVTSNLAPLSGTGSNVVMVGDINGDGFADVMAGGSPYGAVVTFGASTQDLLDAAAGTDELIITIANGSLIETVLAAGDFNGDGLGDFGVLDQNNNFYLILGNANLGPQQTLILNTTTTTSISGIPGAVAAGDYNGDGYGDLLLTNDFGTVRLYKGNSSGALNNEVTFTTNNNTVFNSLGDVNGDGFGDIGGGNPNGNQISPVSTVANGQGSVYLGNASGSSAGSSLNPPTATLSASLDNVWGFSTSDPNSDSVNSTLINQQIDQAPAFAVYNGYLYMAYPGNDSDTLWVQRSADGYNWEGLTNFGSDFKTDSTFSLAVYNNTLYLAFTATDNSIIVTPATADSTSTLGITFNSSNSVNISQTSPTSIAPTLAVYDDELYLFFIANDDNRTVLYSTSSNGTAWSSDTPVTNSSGTNQESGDRLGVAVDGDNLYVGFIGNGNYDLNLATYNGTSWASNAISGQSSYAGPSLLYVDGTLYNFFRASNNNNNILFVTSTDGGNTWSSPASAVPGQTTNSRPDSVYFQESILVGFAGTSSSQAINILTSNPIYEANQTQQFGDQLQPIGDFNGDGLADFAVLAPGFFSNLGSWNNNLLENNQGAVLIYYGSTNGLNSDSNPDVVLALPAPNDSTDVANNQALLLTQLAPTGDINGDGYDDLIVASPTTALNDNDTTDGTSFVVFGGGDSLWGNTYPATSPFNLGNVTPNISQLTLYFSNPLNEANLPGTSTFAVQSGLTSITVTGVTFNNPNELTLTLRSDANISDFLSVTYTKPSSGTALTYATGTTVTTFTAANDAVISTLGAPIIEIETYPQYGFQVTGLPDSQSGISLDGDGDVNGDGFSDFLIGAPGDDDNLTYTIFGSDFLNIVNQTGTLGDDGMQGSPTGESFVAGQGDDLIVTGGGADVVYAGPGDDQVIVNDTYFRRLDGGPGVDVLFFQGYNGQAWDLTTLSPGMRLRNFEILVTEGYGANTLTLNALSVTELSPTNTLTVILDNTDSLVLSSDFSYTELVYQYDRNFSEYRSSTSAATVLVNQPPGSLVTFDAPSSNSPASIFPSNNTAVASAALNANSENFATASFATTATTNNANTNDTPTQIYVSNPTVSERTGRADFTLTRTGDLDKYVWVDYLTQDGDAKAGDRYTPVAGRAVFAPGETSLTVTVPIPNNSKYVGSRQFGLAVSLEGESLDPTVVPDAWKAAIATPNEQIRRWSLIPGEDSNSVAFDITSTHSTDRIVTMDVALDGTVIPLIWNPTAFTYDNLPFSNVNGIAQFQDIDGDLINDLYRLKFQDGGPFDGDRRVNGLVALDFELAQLKPVDVPSTGGRIEGTEGNDYINAQDSTGTNRLDGLGGMDILLGSPQRDVLVGGDGNDQLFGGAGVDQLFGGAGDDLLDGGPGLDFLYGGVGADNFVLRAGDGGDRLMDFNAAEGDLFLLDNFSFGALSFEGNKVSLGAELLATVVDHIGNPVTDLGTNPQWFVSI